MSSSDKDIDKSFLAAKNVSQSKFIEIIEHILRADPAIYQYLNAIGLNKGDAVAIVNKTLRGQDVAYSMYLGLLDGLRQGIEHHAENDKRAAEAVSGWLKETNDPVVE